MDFVCKTSKETKSLGQKVAESLSGDELLLLTGDLGSGKTTFTQGLAKGLGIEEDVVSPTYVFLRSYTGKRLKLYHVDLYRLKEKAELGRLDLEDIKHRSDTIIVVEWPEFFPEIKKRKVIEIFFEINKDGSHLLKVNGLNYTGGL